MEDKPYIKLAESEQAIVHAAATIFAGYLSADRVGEDSRKWLERAVKEAILLAEAIERGVVADAELG